MTEYNVRLGPAALSELASVARADDVYAGELYVWISATEPCFAAVRLWRRSGGTLVVNASERSAIARALRDRENGGIRAALCAQWIAYAGSYTSSQRLDAFAAWSLTAGVRVPCPVPNVVRAADVEKEAA